MTRSGYVLAALAVLLVETGIALFVRDSLVRPYGGDALAVALVYLSLRAATRLERVPAAATAFAVAVAVETGQYFHLSHLLGLGGNRIAEVILGTGFDPLDFVAYAFGALLVLAADRAR